MGFCNEVGHAHQIVGFFRGLGMARKIFPSPQEKRLGVIGYFET